MQIPASNFRTNRFHRLVGNCRTEIDEVLPLSILRSPRPKCIAQKIELLVRVPPPPILILAIDNLRLFRMKLQPTVLQASGYGRPNLLGFPFRPAMHDGIIGETLKRQLPIFRRHPPIKGIMQEQIGQQRADDPALRRALFTRNQLTVLLLHWRFQPALDVENHPWFLGVFLYRTYQQILRDVVEETLDVQIYNPVIAPASLPRLPHCFQRRLPRSIPIGIRMEQRVRRRLQSRLHHLLRNPIRHGRYAPLPFPTVCFRYLHRPRRRRKVTARRHPIPDLVQVPFQVPFEIRNGLLVDPCRSMVRFYSFIRLPDLPFGNTERLCLTHRLLPLLVGSLNQGSMTQPLGSIPFRRLHRYYGLFRPWAPLPYSRPHGSSTCGFSVRIGVPGSHVPLDRLLASSSHLNAGCRSV